MWALPMFLWPFRSILLPNADSKSKKRFGSLEVSEKISPVVIEEGELSEQFSKVIAPRGIMIFALLDIGFVSYKHHMYRVFQQLADLGCVALDLMCFSICPVLTRQMGLAVMAEQLGKMVEHSKSKSTQPKYTS